MKYEIGSGTTFGYRKNNKRENVKIISFIDKTIIEGGDIVVLFGQSGIGKSTILEGLGLMEDTILEGSAILTINGDKYDLEGLVFDKVKKKRLGNDEVCLPEQIRRKYYSYIFQEADVIENLTCEQNIKMANDFKLCEDNENPAADIEERIKILAKDFGLLEFLDHTPGEISGGQKQRVVFTRALLPHFEVLFADEPTGDIDEYLSDSMMEKMADKITSDKSDKIAIIVSHKIDLSVKHANKIIAITKNSEGTTKSKIIAEHIYQKDKVTEIWSNGKGKTINNLQEVLRKLLKEGN
ncbi:MAG: ATP-binding cassette domain-containing protein [Candidatus Cloacimonetes bacterium]|nr:ATP-binding cassette domain-containing protein [Candidatus Cloacimonadota bacterium]